MKTVYKSGISWGLVTFIALVILLCYLFILFLLPWIGVILLLITTVFIVDVFHPLHFKEPIREIADALIDIHEALTI